MFHFSNLWCHFVRYSPNFFCAVLAFSALFNNFPGFVISGNSVLTNFAAFDCLLHISFSWYSFNMGILRCKALGGLLQSHTAAGHENKFRNWANISLTRIQMLQLCKSNTISTIMAKQLCSSNDIMVNIKRHMSKCSGRHHSRITRIWNMLRACDKYQRSRQTGFLLNSQYDSRHKQKTNYNSGIQWILYLGFED